MTQSSNKILDDIAKLMSDAAGVAQGVSNEVAMVFKTQLERLLSDMDLVQREEFEIVRELATKAREENSQLKKKIKNLEATLLKHGLSTKESKAKQTDSEQSKIDD